MKKLSVLSILFLTLFSCTPQPEGGILTSRNGDYNTKVIDSCEYIEYDYGVVDQRVYSLTHKGNCKYCKSRQNEK